MEPSSEAVSREASRGVARRKDRSGEFRVSFMVGLFVDELPRRGGNEYAAQRPVVFAVRECSART